MRRSEEYAFLRSGYDVLFFIVVEFVVGIGGSGFGFFCFFFWIIVVIFFGYC